MIRNVFVMTRIDVCIAIFRCAERKEQCLRHHKSYDEGLERKKLLEDMIVQFITSRLNVSGDKNHHQLSLQPHSPDEVSEHDPNSVWVIREKPDELTPYELSCGKVAT